MLYLSRQHEAPQLAFQIMNSRFAAFAHSAFTLVELLVVLALFAGLVALLLPAYSRPHERGVSRVKIEISAIATAIREYEAEYGVLPVTSIASNAAAAEKA